ncbi:kielin/chordin-like protein [Helicoverpa zea]|uniref:kielin/chordin-like protein n=1 Tax=Helicoverpa zea TaxID=7113 RepID=UPI001F575C6C|nr:kielin/chordin-like protein [Helicoverpa zea]
MKLPPEYDENGNPVFLVIKDARRCKNGRWHMIDSCNSCYCHLHVWFCTDNIHCVPDKYKKTPVDRKCPLGHQFRLGTCHRCYCRPFKLKKYLCNPDIKCNIVSDCPKDRNLDPKTCQALETRYCDLGHRLTLDECNYCICFQKKYFCTDIECSIFKIKGRSGRCVEGHKYYLADSCNFCICQGGQEFCTSRPCLPNADAQLQGGSTSRAVASRQLETCVDYEELPSGGACNTCICLHGRKICTMTHCTDSTADWTTRPAAAHNHIQYKTRNAACPKGTFIHNPNQPCSICLCGGNDPGSHNMCFTDAECVKQVISHLIG